MPWSAWNPGRSLVKLDDPKGGAIAEASLAIFWFRRDLRWHDNVGLDAALSSGKKVLPIFIFDPTILDRLEDKDDPRVEFIHRQLRALNGALENHKASICVLHAKPLDAFKRLLKENKISAVYCSHDYEPSTIARDSEIEKFLSSQNIEFHSYKDQVVFEKNQVAKDTGGPYTIFTPYSRKWKAQLKEQGKSALRVHSSEKKLAEILKQDFKIPSLEEIGFKKTGFAFPGLQVNKKQISSYERDRNFPALNATTHLGLHLRFGTESIRNLVQIAEKQSEVWLGELIWREFFMQILYNFPHVVNEPFHAKYKGIKWRRSESDFQKWCAGKTGYPIVDAGMRELNSTGFMHNRVRMITGSFLAKHLLLDWRQGEAYFARRLLDFDLAANNGNWQWVAGTGCDAAPYFRVFNPALQTEKFDPDLLYIKKWVPEYGTPDYPEPMVEHKMARDRALKAYKDGLGK
jgi:deoxyribodipyrimidine photo-lyase